MPSHNVLTPTTTSNKHGHFATNMKHFASLLVDPVDQILIKILINTFSAITFKLCCLYFIKVIFPLSYTLWFHIKSVYSRSIARL